jgi:hypothetical protein
LYKGISFLFNQTYLYEDKMKKLVATMCIAGTVLALAACESTGNGNVETAPPYASERTAGANDAPATKTTAHSERVFRGAQSK